MSNRYFGQDGQGGSLGGGNIVTGEQEGGGSLYSTFRFNRQASVSHAPQTYQQYQ